MGGMAPPMGGMAPPMFMLGSNWAWAGAVKRSEATRASVVPIVTIRQRATLDLDSTVKPSRL